MVRLLHVALFIGLSATPLTFAASKTVRYCVPVQKIDYNPYRRIDDGKELAYITLLKSYISTDSNEPGILSSYEFSPDGSEFTGRIAQGLKWSDGTELTSQQAADGISKTLKFRMLGERIKVARTDIVDASTFKIRFESKIQNLTGVVREALSTNSRHNRFWPVKIVKGKAAPLVLGKFPQKDDNTFDVLGQNVQVVSQAKCEAAELSIFPEALKVKTSDYTIQRSPTASAVTLQVNTAKVGTTERKVLIGVLRSIFANAPETTGITQVESFFLAGEPGFNPKVKWPPIKEKPSRQFVIGYEHPIFKRIVESAPPGTQIKLVALPSSEILDGQILASGMHEGRHVIFQDILKWPRVSEFLTQAPRTKKVLEDISARSASTIPPDNQILGAFETAAMDEAALAPLARRHPIAYSLSSIPIRLSFSSKGEITFTSASQ